MIVWVGAVVLGVLGGLLYVMFFFRLESDGNSKLIQRVREKTVYVEQSAVTEAVKSIADSLWLIYAQADTSNVLSNYGYCTQENSLVKDCNFEAANALVLTADGYLISAKIPVKDEMVARDQFGNTLSVSKVAESADFIFWKANFTAEQKRTIAFKIAEFSDAEYWQSGQQVMAAGFLGKPEQVAVTPGMINSFSWSNLHGVVEMSRLRDHLVLVFASNDKLHDDRAMSALPIFDYSGKLVAWKNGDRFWNVLEIRGLLARARNGKSLETASFGFNFIQLNKEQSQKLALKVDQGAVLTSADGKLQGNMPPVGSLAEALGLKIGDVLLSINGVSLNSELETIAQLLQLAPGERPRLTLLRGGSEVEVK